MKQIIGILLAGACLCGGLWETTGQETQDSETLEVRYNDSGGTTRTLQVEKDVEVLKFRYNINELTLPEGLTKLHSLEIYNLSTTTLTLQRSLTLPKDIGKDADWPFRLVLGRPIPLRVHRDMGRFSLLVLNHWDNYNFFGVPLRIPSAKDLIRNREPDDDGIFRIPMNAGGIEHKLEFTIEVHGIPPQIWLNRREGGVEIVWDRSQLQSAPSIDGPWTDITFDDTRRLFLRSSSPAEFFRVKPMAEDESPTETQQSTPSKPPHFLL